MSDGGQSLDAAALLQRLCRYHVVSEGRRQAEARPARHSICRSRDRRSKLSETLSAPEVVKCEQAEKEAKCHVS